MFGKLPIVAGSAVNVAAFREEALRSYWPFAAITGETLIMPRVPFVLNSLCAWKKIPDVMNCKVREKNNTDSVVDLHQLPSPAECVTACHHQAALFRPQPLATVQKEFRVHGDVSMYQRCYSLWSSWRLRINLDFNFIAVTLFIKTLPKSHGDIFRVRRKLSCSFL